MPLERPPVLSVKPQKKTKQYLTNIAFFIVPLIIVLILRTFILGNYSIPSSSMENTLLIGDRVVTVTESNPQRGEIVVFKDSQKWLGNNYGSDYLVKRVAAVGGDTIAGINGQIIVNGKVLDESAYIKGNNVGPNSDFPEQSVPQGSIFVLGDNRQNSADSRFHINAGTQFISLDDVAGKASVIYWPLDRIRTIH